MSKSVMQQKFTSPLLTIAAVAGLALSILLVQRVAFAAEPAVQIGRTGGADRPTGAR